MTVVAGSRRVDLALPGTVAVGELLPQVLQLCGTPTGSAEPVRWALTRLDGQELRADRCLADAGVRDGEVLALLARPTAVQPAYIEDVRDLVEDTVDATGTRWTPRTTMAFTLLAGAGGLVLAALAPLLGSGGPAAALVAAAPATAAAVVAVAGSVAAAWWASRRHHPAAARVLASTACLWGGIAGLQPAGGWGLPATLALGGAAAGVLGAAVATRLVTRHAAAHLATAGVLAAVAAVVVVVAAVAGGDALPGVRVAALLLVLVIGVVPRIAVTAGGLGLADYQVRHGGRLSPATVTERFRRGEALLTGTLVGVAVAAAGLALTLVMAPAAGDRWLGTLTAVALLLRSRVFSRVAHLLPLRLAGMLVLAGELGLLAGQTPVLSAWLPALAVAGLLALVAASAVSSSDVSRARVKQLLDATEVVVVAALIPVMAGALGWFGLAARIVG